MSAEEAIARAKAIAARLAGTGATAATAASAPAFNVNAVADAALAAANGGGSGKRKRWGDQSNSQPENNGGGAPMTGSLIDEALAQAMNAKRSNTGSAGVGGGGGGGSGGYGSSSASVYGGGGGGGAGGGGGHGHQSTKKLMIPVEKYPGYNFIGLLIGPGGSKQRELVQQSGGNVKISIRGKGSSSSNDGGPGMDEPLHVLLEGMAENVSRAEALIEPLLNDPETAQAEKDRQLKGLPGASSGSTTGAGTASTYQYTPKPVAQILGLNGGGHYGPALGQEGIEEKIGIPNGFVGFIIGKGGESITSMQRKSGCKVQIEKEHEMEPGSTQRIITLTGATPESVSMCRGIIEEMVQERARLNESRNSGGMGGGMGGGGVGFNRMGPGSNASGQAAQLQTALSEGQSHVEVQVPNNDVGLVIGKGGSTIRSIQERSGANVQIPQGPDHDNPAVRTVNITHPQMSGAEFAKTLIEEVLGSKTHHGGGGGGGMGGGGYGNNPNDATVQVQIPDQDVGMCIGKSGCVIREMQQRTKTRIQIPSQPTPGAMYRMASVSGPAEGCAKVQEIIARISMEQSSQFVMTGECFGGAAGGGGAGGGYGQQQAYGQQPAYGQQSAYGQQQQQQYAQGAAAGGQQQGQGGDYSAQWAAYYAAQAAAQGGTAAAATGATAAVTAPTPAAAASTATATTGAAAGGQKADAYYEDFFRYAYHYGEDAARKAYSSWSPPAGTPNPYGVNPNPSTPAAGGAAAAPVSAPASAPADVKDSSVRRGVSNLPAWMTKS